MSPPGPRFSFKLFAGMNRIRGSLGVIGPMRTSVMLAQYRIDGAGIIDDDETAMQTAAGH